MSYSFKDGIYKIEGYDRKKPFCSFLPGIAGVLGKPLWCYYVNRGQVVSSFGVKDKGSPILEFSPGSIAYQKVSLDGFRTFFKVNGEYIEPFGLLNPDKCNRDMLINESSVGITEVNESLGYSIDVFRGKTPAEYNFFTYALFVSFFPQLVAGPIERSTNLLRQFKKKHNFDYDQFMSGICLMLWGYFLKLVVADRCGIYVDSIFNNVHHHNGGSFLIASILFPFPHSTTISITAFEANNKNAL